ncbi:hypothetical protein FE257_003564 [Aspergillus nanangensis]|uniref:Uncharacterized protein n=1 Tax=Aspergillus nanangensis TaxID=2582783 RepID=A0AAD4GPH5_ASPNN|nr:hypothetical protein FE257_003564 [Aspergillus nanangensis]
MGWFLPRDGGMEPEPEKRATHPEHWVVRPGDGSKTMTVLETLGEKPTLFSLVFGVERAEFVEDDPNFTAKMTSRGYIEGGIQIMELYHQFEEHVVECHRQHLLAEFSNWSKQAYEASMVA